MDYVNQLKEQASALWCKNKAVRIISRVILGYALLGFIIAPLFLFIATPIIAPSFLNERKVSIGFIYFNPFTT